MSYDVVVIGSGPGGYVCAIKCAQLGLKTAIVEKRETLGGTCLNIGCIPSKALLQASELFVEAEHTLPKMGVKVAKPKLDLKAMMAHKDATVKSNVDGVAFLMKKNKVDVIQGTGKVLGEGKISVAGEDGKEQEIEAKNIVIATGSDVAGIPGVEVKFDEKVIVSSTGALELSKVPGHMVVVGGGVIGLELGSVWKRLGAEVTVVEYLDTILGGMDGEVSKQFQRMLEKQGMKFNLGAKVTGVKKTAKGADVTFEPAKGGDAQTLNADVVLVATGRKPYTEGLGLEKAGVVLDERGRVQINEHWQTSITGIYALGDVVAGPMLAHKAEDEGMAVAEILAGQHGHVNFDVIPGVVYTEPEVASVGKTEEELKKAGVEYVSGKFPFAANGRARAMLATDGFVKVLADKKPTACSVSTSSARAPAR
jgi:dihydrolipoamide dehydrogenase